MPTGTPAHDTDVKDEFFDRRWSPLKRLQRSLTAPLFRIADTGWLGLRPLQQHILICGFPRSGTTLLQMMIENGLPEARRFGRETSAWRAATFSLRNHPVVISKMPHDLLRLGAVRNFYASRAAQLKVVLVLRDPRDVLTSQRTTGGPAGYVVCAQRWRAYYQAFIRHNEDSDTLLVRYEDLVGDAAREQARLEKFTGRQMVVSFERFHTIERADFDTSTLNGLRPVETTLLRRWATPRHRQRMREVLAELPHLADDLVSLGYERDDRWLHAWQDEPSESTPATAGAAPASVPEPAMTSPTRDADNHAL